jgi:hypothetical protein
MSVLDFFLNCLKDIGEYAEDFRVAVPTYEMDVEQA